MSTPVSRGRRPLPVVVQGSGGLAHFGPRPQPWAPCWLLPRAGGLTPRSPQGNQSCPGSRAPPRSMRPRAPGRTCRTAARTPTTSCTHWTGRVGAGEACARGCPARPPTPRWAYCHGAVIFFSEDRDTTAGPEGHPAKEDPPAAAEDGRESEPSDEEATTLSAESGDTADEDAPGPAAPPEDSVDLLGLHAEAGPAPCPQARGGPPSNADLLSCLLGAPPPAPAGTTGRLLEGDTSLLFSSPAPPPSAPTAPREASAPAGRCRLGGWTRGSGSLGVVGAGAAPPPSPQAPEGLGTALCPPLGAAASTGGRRLRLAWSGRSGRGRPAALTVALRFLLSCPS